MCALAESESWLKGKVVDTTRGAATLKVVIAPSGNSSNKLATTRSSGSKMLGKNASIVAELPCLMQKNKTTLSASTRWEQARASPRVCRVCGKKQNYSDCNDSRCSRGGSSCEPIQQTGYKPVERVDLCWNKCDYCRERPSKVAAEVES
jgi:hypothetical protein